MPLRPQLVVTLAAVLLTALPAAARAQARPAGGAAAPAADSVARERDRLMNEVLASIAGREEQPAESVFTNIRMMRGVPAGRLLRIMNQGFGRSLGVSCTHCHVTGEWDSEEKPQKQIARDMSAMARTINGELLAGISNLKSERPTVNCTPVTGAR